MANRVRKLLIDEAMRIFNQVDDVTNISHRALIRAALDNVAEKYSLDGCVNEYKRLRRL